MRLVHERLHEHAADYVDDDVDMPECRLRNGIESAKLRRIEGIGNLGDNVARRGFDFCFGRSDRRRVDVAEGDVHPRIHQSHGDGLAYSAGAADDRGPAAS